VSANGYYNGFSPADRNGTLAIVRAALADGRLPAPTRCSVCGDQPAKPLQWHSEDYRKPLDARPICRGCHIRIHARFRHPDRWREYISGLDPAGWYQNLSVDPRSLTRPFDETHSTR
jgi:hypothetical protein